MSAGHLSLNQIQPALDPAQTLVEPVDALAQTTKERQDLPLVQL